VICCFSVNHLFAEKVNLEYQKVKLENGLNVIMLEDHDNPSVSFNIFVKASNLTEKENILGISHFCEHLFFRGTDKINGQDLKKRIEIMGAEVNGVTNKNFTQYYVNVPSKYLGEAVEIFYEALSNPAYKSDDVEKERNIILEEYNLSINNPFANMLNELYYLSFKNHPYQYPTIGSATTLKSITRNDLISYYKKYYFPENITIVITGDFYSSQILPLLRNTFAKLKNEPAQNKVESYEYIHTSNETVERKDVSSGLLAIGYYVPSIRDKNELYAIDVLTFILGQGEGAYLNSIKHSKALESISVDFITSKEPGLLIISAAFKNDKYKEIKDAILTKLDFIRKGVLSDSDFERGKKFLVGSFVFQNESNKGKASTLGFYESIYDAGFAESYLEQISKVSKEDVIRAARKYLNENYNMVVYLPNSQEK
jgi:zinc protease